MARNYENPRSQRKHGDISLKQEIFEEVFDPDREKRKKEALKKSPKVRIKDLIQLDSKTLIQFKKGSNKQKALKNFKRNYEKIYSI